MPYWHMTRWRAWPARWRRRQAWLWSWARSPLAHMLDIEKIVRETVKEIGYTRSDYGFDAETCGVLISIKEQSDDIKQGVDTALEARDGSRTDADVATTGAGDQGMMIGFACEETPELMPLTVSLAHGLTRRLATARKSGRTALAATGRQEPGHGRVCLWAAEASRYDCDFHATRAGVVPGGNPAADYRLRRARCCAGKIHRCRYTILYQSDRPFCHRWPAGRCRFDRAQDHCRYLWRCRPARRRRFFRQGRH